MKAKILLCAAVLMASLGATRIVTAKEDASQPPSKEQAEQQASASPSVAPMVPKLNITWECGDCEKNAKIAPLIEQNYAAEAKSNGAALSESEVAEVAIIDFRQRPPGGRFMLGFLAGKDKLGLRIRYKGREMLVDDYAVNAFTGMNALCEVIAKKAYASLINKSD